MKNYRLYLIRHGITSGNLEGKYIGTTDLPLCEEGEDAISSLAALDVYPKVQKVYSSPLKRCLQTADIIYPERLLKRIDGIAELDFGEYEGKRKPSFRAMKSISNGLRADMMPHLRMVKATDILH